MLRDRVAGVGGCLVCSFFIQFSPLSLSWALSPTTARKMKGSRLKLGISALLLAVSNFSTGDDGFQQGAIMPTRKLRV